MGLDSMSEQVVYLHPRGFLHNTLVHNLLTHLGIMEILREQQAGSYLLLRITLLQEFQQLFVNFTVFFR